MKGDRGERRAVRMTAPDGNRRIGASPDDDGRDARDGKRSPGVSLCVREKD